MCADLLIHAYNHIILLCYYVIIILLLCHIYYYHTTCSYTNVQVLRMLGGGKDGDGPPFQVPAT